MDNALHIILFVTIWPKQTGIFATFPSRGYEKKFEFLLSDFKSLNTVSIKETPFINTYITLRSSIKDFYTELKTNILEKYPYVTKVKTDSANPIYSSNLQFELGNSFLSPYIIDIPLDFYKNNKSVNYEQFFRNDLWNKAKESKQPLCRKFIGYTGKSEEELSQGIEVKVKINLKDKLKPIEVYIYLKGAKEVVIKNNVFDYYSFYTLPENAYEELINELDRIQCLYADLLSVNFCKFFDDDIALNDIQDKTPAYFIDSIHYYYEVTFTKELGLIIRKNERTKKDVALCSKFTPSFLNKWEKLELTLGKI